MKKGGKSLSPLKRKACQSISTALMHSVSEIGTQCTMKNINGTLHELTPHIPQKTSKMNTSSSTNEILHTDITVRIK
jgi:hypothetical protein